MKLVTPDERLWAIALPSEGVEWALSGFPKASLDYGPPPTAETKFEAVGDRYFLPRSFWGRLNDPALPTIHMELQYDGRRIVVLELRLRAEPSGPGPASIDLGVVGDLQAVRRLPFKRIVSAIAAFSAFSASVAPDGSLVLRELQDHEHADFLRVLARHERASRISAGTDKLLKEVAIVYRQARDAPAPAGTRRAPVRAVVDHWGCSRATASRWIREARDRGHLEKTKRERAGT